MCGITGYLSSRPDDAQQLRNHARQMCDAIAHRGPDDEGLWLDAEQRVVLGHRRLSIVDLSPQGHQPMASACGRYVMVYNGEIYNHQALRASLPPQAWRGHSDTETVLAMFSQHGVAASLPLLVGMFAIALWDRQTSTLVLVRDRLGEKPLYYGHLPSGDFVFGSELKALRAHPRWQGSIDRNALALYMRHNVVPAPHSIYQGIHKLPPAHWLVLGPGGAVQINHYWSVQEVARQGQLAPSNWSDTEATDRLEAMLAQAVQGQMLADVPLGAFLSGGVDSSTIVALMVRHNTQPVRTFAIGFSEAGFNEAAHAKAVAAHLGTAHTELYVTPADALAVIPRLPSIYDEPFADSSQIPTFLVAQMARQHVTVALSGDGGDELFAGYNRYLLADRLWHRLARLPLPLRQLLARAMLVLPPGGWNALAAPLMRALPAARRQAQLGDKLHKFARSVMPAADASAMYRALVSHWQDPAAVVLGATEPYTLLDKARFDLQQRNAVEQMCLLDQQTYLPDDILVKVDRAAMAVSLETRVPLLDHRVVEFAWQLPMHQKIRDGQTKWLLRQVLYRHVPPALIERPKQGFAVPLDQWLRGPLRGWAEALLNPQRLREDGIFDAALLRRTWQEHQSGSRNWQYQLWDVLMFQAWHDSVQARPG